MPHKLQVLDVPAEFWSGLGNWAARILGAIIGSAISIAYFLPASRREAALRFLTGLAVGSVFGTLTGHKLAAQLELNAVLSPTEITLIGATTASLCAWWGLGVLGRAASHYGNQPGKTEDSKKGA